MTIRLLITIPNGLGDAIQTLPALHFLASKVNGTIYLLLNKHYQEIFKEVFFINYHFLSLEDFERNKSCGARFDMLLDLNGLLDLGRLRKIYRFKIEITHTIFKDPSIKNGSKCIRVNDTFVDSVFFNAVGLPPKQAWTFYAEMMRLCILASGCASQLEPSSISLMSAASNLIQQNSKRRNNTHRSIGLLPCGTLRTKLWPLSNYLSLGSYFIRLGYKVTFYLGPSEHYLIGKIRSCEEDYQAVFETELSSLATKLIEHDLIISNDCGPMHIAGIMGCPLVAIFRDTLPQCWFPYNGSNQFFIGGLLYGDVYYPRGRNATKWVSTEEVKALALRVLRSTNNEKLN